jgi:hypothetical protein
MQENSNTRIEVPVGQGIKQNPISKITNTYIHIHKQLAEWPKW